MNYYNDNSYDEDYQDNYYYDDEYDDADDNDESDDEYDESDDEYDEYDDEYDDENGVVDKDEYADNDDYITLYHAAKYEKYTYPNWNRIKSHTDFGKKLYFSLNKEDANDYANSHGTQGNIVSIKIPSIILDLNTTTYDGLRIINYGDPFEGTMEFMDRMEWTCQVIANRKGYLDYLDEKIYDSDIIIGPRADILIRKYLERLKFDPEEDFDNYPRLEEIYNDLSPSNYPIQVALNKIAFDKLIGEFTDDMWI